MSHLAAPPSTACANGGSEKQTHGMYLTDTLDTMREQQFDRMGLSVIGSISCKSDITSTNPVCHMKTPGHTLALSAHHDRQTGKCGYNTNAKQDVS